MNWVVIIFTYVMCVVCLKTQVEEPSRKTYEQTPQGLKLEHLKEITSVIDYRFATWEYSGKERWNCASTKSESPKVVLYNYQVLSWADDHSSYMAAMSGYLCSFEKKILAKDKLRCYRTALSATLKLRPTDTQEDILSKFILLVTKGAPEIEEQLMQISNEIRKIQAENSEKGKKRRKKTMFISCPKRCGAESGKKELEPHFAGIFKEADVNEAESIFYKNYDDIQKYFEQTEQALSTITNEEQRKEEQSRLRNNQALLIYIKDFILSRMRVIACNVDVATQNHIDNNTVGKVGGIDREIEMCDPLRNQLALKYVQAGIGKPEAAKSKQEALENQVSIWVETLGNIMSQFGSLCNDIEMLGTNGVIM